MPVLKNARHERFAQELAKGSTQEEAYLAAGYAPAGARQNASRLMTKDDIASRVTEIKGRAAEKIEWGIADAVRELEEARSLAFQVGQASAAVAATRAKLEALGLKPADKLEHSGSLTVTHEDRLKALG